MSINRKFRNTQSFIEDAIAIHGNKFNYSEVIFKNINSKVLIGCPAHGVFSVTPKVHLKHMGGCRLCASEKHGTLCRKSITQFVIDATNIHGDSYDYTKVNYLGTDKKVIILCNIHGPFSQTPANHLNGQRCPECARKFKGGLGGYSHEFFITHPQKKTTDAILYVARIKYDNDDFLKLGITTKESVKERFYYKTKGDMKVVPLIERKMTLFEAFTQEQYLLTVLKDKKYFPNRRFEGKTECVKLNGEVLTLLATYFDLNSINVPDL
jgi:hypothetical protein